METEFEGPAQIVPIDGATAVAEKAATPAKIAGTAELSVVYIELTASWARTTVTEVKSDQ